MQKFKLTKGYKTCAILLGITLYIILIVSASLDNMYELTQLDWFNYAFCMPFIMLTKLFNKLMDFRVAYFFVFLVSAIIFSFVNIAILKYFKKIIVAYAKLLKAYKGTYNNEDEKIDAMFKPLEDADFSFLKIILSIFATFLYYGIIRTFFSAIFKDNILSLFNVNSLEVFWFTLNGKEQYPILFTLFLILSYGVSIYKFIYEIIKNKHEENKKEKNHLAFYMLLISFSLHTLILWSVLNSAIFAIFICAIYIASLTIQIIKYFNKKPLEL